MNQCNLIIIINFFFINIYLKMLFIILLIIVICIIIINVMYYWNDINNYISPLSSDIGANAMVVQYINEQNNLGLYLYNPSTNTIQPQ